jgi:hypothetical protein
MAIIPHTPRLSDDNTILADWLEFEALTSDNGGCSLLELARQLGIAGVGDAENEALLEPRQFADNPKLDEVMNEIEGRSAGCSDGYPFEIDSAGNSISRKADWTEYTYTNLLLISLIDCHTSVQSTAGPIYPARLFEAICVVVAEKYLGGRELGAKAYHFGAPRPDGSGFSTALKALAASLKGTPHDIIDPSAEKDDGLDVLAWRPFADMRCNFMCLFGQCATGANWPEKMPQPLEFLNVWLRLETPAVNPALFVPFTLKQVEWMKKSQSAIVFDRCRISTLVPRIVNGASHELVRALVSTLLAA